MMMETILQVKCPSNDSSQCVLLRADAASGPPLIMWLFKVIQNGLVFAALVSGVVVGGHLVYCTSAKCRNWLLVFITIVTGFFHMLTCLFLLGLSELSGMSEFPQGGEQDCLDYSASSSLANTILLTVVATSIIKQNTNSRLRSHVGTILLILSTTLGIALLNNNDSTPESVKQNAFLTLGKKETPHVDVFWSMCQRLVSEEQYRLLCEYFLIYIPVAMVVCVAWYRTYKRTGEAALVRLKILDHGCQEKGFTSCICTRLNTAYAAILFYSFIVLFIGRPAMILYGHMTSGAFRDIFPSLLQSVAYCFFCSEYIIWCYRLNLIRPRRTSSKSSSVILV